MRKNQQQILFAGVLIALCLILAVCIVIALVKRFGNRKTEDHTTEPSEVVTEMIAEAPTEEVTEEVTEVVEETHEGQAKSYLTGEWIDEDLASDRPVALMVENTSMSLPQYGIGQADVIYECPVEGGITRLMAIFQDYSGMDKVGNVRSCRNYYVYFAKEFDAVYMHAGKSHFAEDLLNSTFIDNVDGVTGKGGSYYYRVSSRKAPHNLYTSSALMAKAISGYGYDSKVSSSYTGHYQFAEDGESVTLDNGTDATKVEMYYTNPKPWFEYNAEDGLYYRFEFGGKQVDAITGEQLAVKNIIIQNCSWYLWESSTGYLYIDYMSGGSGKYITNGKCIDITWKRNSESGPTRYYDSDGNEITLNQGKTWVEIVQNDYAGKNKID